LIAQSRSQYRQSRTLALQDSQRNRRRLTAFLMDLLGMIDLRESDSRGRSRRLINLA
jgi:hypothetical protein